MSDIKSPTAAHVCTQVLKRLRLQIAHHPLFDEHTEILFDLVNKGQNYKNAPEWLELQQRLQALESEL